MRSPHETRRSGGGPKASSRYETTNSRVPATSSGEDDSYDFRADLKLGSRNKAVHQEEQRSSPVKPQQQAAVRQQKAPVRQQQKKKAGKTLRKKFGRPKEKKYKSGTELLEALGEVADDDAKAAADALGRDLELMGYDLDCETFITKGSSDAEEEEDRYASRGPQDASLKSRSASFEQTSHYNLDEEENENIAEEEAIEEEDQDENEEDIEEVDQDEEGLDEEDQEEASIDVRDASNSKRGEISSGFVNDNTMGSYQSVASSKSRSVREEKPSRKVAGNQKPSKPVSKLVSGAKGLSKVNASKPMRGNKNRDAKNLQAKPAKSTSKSKALALAKETPEEKAKAKAVVIEGMSIFNEDGYVSVAPSGPPPMDFWENEDANEDKGNFATKKAISHQSRGPPEIAQDMPYHGAEELSYYPPVQEKKKFWLPFRRAASTRQKFAFQSEDEKIQNDEIDNEELITQEAPGLIPAPDLSVVALDPAPAPDASAKTNSDGSICEASEASDSAINFFESSVIDGTTTKKNRCWLPTWNVGGETRQEAEAEAEEQHTPKQSSPAPTPLPKKYPGLHASQDRVRPQLTLPEPQGSPVKQQSFPKSPAHKVLLLSAQPSPQSFPRSPARSKVHLFSADPEKSDSKPKVSLPSAALIDFTESGVGSESGESIEISEGGGTGSKTRHDETPQKKVIRVAVDADKKKSSLFSRFRRNKKAAIEAGTRRMDVIQENEDEEGFDVEFIISSGTVGTLYERAAPRNEIPNSSESVAESVETVSVRTPIPAPGPTPVAPAPTVVAPTPAPVAPTPVAPAPTTVATLPLPAMANKKKTKGGEGTIRSGPRSINEAPSSGHSLTPKLANTFSDFVEAIFADTPKTNAPRNKLSDSFETAPSGSIASTWGLQNDGPPRLVLADTHLTDISPPEVSPITKTVNDRNLRVLGVSQTESLMDEGLGLAPKLTNGTKEKKMAPKPVQRRSFFQRRTRNTAPVQQKAKPSYPIKNGQDKTIKNGQDKTNSELHNKESLQLQQDSQWRRSGQAPQQKEIPPPPIEAKDRKMAMDAMDAMDAMNTINPRRHASRLSEGSSAAAVGSSLGFGPLPTFWSATAAAAAIASVEDAQQYEAQQYETEHSLLSQASSVASNSTRGTWNEIVDASRIVGKAFRSVELSPSDDEEDSPEERLDNLMSIVSDDSSLGDVERALEVLKKHANRLGIRESDLLQSLKSDEDALLRNIRSKSDMKSEIKFAKSEEDEREDESLYMISGVGSGNVSGVLSGDDGFDEEASIRSLTLAEELMYAFQVYTTGVPKKK